MGVILDQSLGSWELRSYGISHFGVVIKLDVISNLGFVN